MTKVNVAHDGRGGARVSVAPGPKRPWERSVLCTLHGHDGKTESRVVLAFLAASDEPVVPVTEDRDLRPREVRADAVEQLVKDGVLVKRGDFYHKVGQVSKLVTVPAEAEGKFHVAIPPRTKVKVRYNEREFEFVSDRGFADEEIRLAWVL